MTNAVTAVTWNTEKEQQHSLAQNPSRGDDANTKSYGTSEFGKELGGRQRQ